MSEILYPDMLHPRAPRPGGDADAFADIELLHSISVALIGEQDRTELYGKIVDAAVSITGSQFGTMQLLMPSDDPSGHGGELKLLCSRGLPPEAVGFWQWVRPTAYSSCTVALKRGSRAVIPDFEAWDEIAGTDDLLAFQRTGIRSAQTTPLRSRNGALLGMISTHWSEPHEPSERDLRLLDILARQAADLLDRTIAEEALRESEALQKMLSGELSHRVKNMLATVQAIAVQTLRHCDDPSDFVESFGGRIQSMSSVHSQLSTNEWRGTQLSDIVQDQMRLGPVDEAQISASGPTVHIDSALVPKVAMILHELGTNSLKYGALSKASGAVAIEWAVSGQRLELLWSEHGGPQVKAPFRRGFGTKLLEASARGGDGGATMSVEDGAVRWRIVLPLTDGPEPEAALASAPAPNETRPGRESSTPGGKLRGKRILVVEDEPLLAMDIAGHLEAAGAAVIGPAGSATAALALIEEYRFDAALLDANLGGETVDGIAAALMRNKVPFVFVTGYGRDSLPKAFCDSPLLPKPFSGKQLIDAATNLVANAA